MVMTLIFTYTSVGYSYEVKSKTSTSYILVREAHANFFEILYCQQGAVECVHLGKKTVTSPL